LIPLANFAGQISGSLPFKIRANAGHKVRSRSVPNRPFEVYFLVWAQGQKGHISVSHPALNVPQGDGASLLNPGGLDAVWNIAPVDEVLNHKIRPTGWCGQCQGAGSRGAMCHIYLPLFVFFLAFFGAKVLPFCRAWIAAFFSSISGPKLFESNRTWFRFAVNSSGLSPSFSVIVRRFFACSAGGFAWGGHANRFAF